MRRHVLTYITFVGGGQHHEVIVRAWTKRGFIRKLQKLGLR
jgi:hypothetical protein